MPIRANQVGVIDNAGLNTLVSFLRNTGAKASALDLAAAFVTSAGLESILHLLQQTAGNGQVRLLTGLYQGFTEPKALQTLLRAQNETRGRLSVRISTIPHFHWKAYFILKRRSATVVVGSSNLTDDGLRTAGEFNVIVTLKRSSGQFEDIHGVFERHWKSKSTQLSQNVVQTYRDWRKEAVSGGKRVAVPLAKILGKPAKAPKTKPGEIRYWRHSITGFLAEETTAVLRETTDWDRRGLSYINTWKPTYSIGDRIVIFDSVDNFIRLVEVADTTQTPQRTPDGRHFAAFRRVRRLPQRRMVSKRWKSLKRAGLLSRKGDVNTSKRLSEKAFTGFVENLKQVLR